MCCFVYAAAFVCSMLDKERDWDPSTTIKQMLRGIFDMLDDTNVSESGL